MARGRKPNLNGVPRRLRPKGEKKKPRKCSVCHTGLFEDETKTVCQDCDGVLRNIKGHGAWAGPDLTDPQMADRLARVEAHQKRVWEQMPEAERAAYLENGRDW